MFPPHLCSGPRVSLVPLGDFDGASNTGGIREEQGMTSCHLAIEDDVERRHRGTGPKRTKQRWIRAADGVPVQVRGIPRIQLIEETLIPNGTKKLDAWVTCGSPPYTLNVLVAVARLADHDKRQLSRTAGVSLDDHFDVVLGLKPRHDEVELTRLEAQLTQQVRPRGDDRSSVRDVDAVSPVVGSHVGDDASCVSDNPVRPLDTESLGPAVVTDASAGPLCSLPLEAVEMNDRREVSGLEQRQEWSVGRIEQDEGVGSTSDGVKNGEQRMTQGFERLRPQGRQIHQPHAQVFLLRLPRVSAVDGHLVPRQH